MFVTNYSSHLGAKNLISLELTGKKASVKTKLLSKGLVTLKPFGLGAFEEDICWLKVILLRAGQCHLNEVDPVKLPQHFRDMGHFLKKGKPIEALGLCVTEVCNALPDMIFAGSLSFERQAKVQKCLVIAFKDMFCEQTDYSVDGLSLISSSIYL